jgi:ABC-2 type transport system ATP-binding protein
MTSSPIIIANKLVRNFKKTIAVNELDLNIKKGELFGLVGPDGAGKTTTLRLLAGLLDIDDGEASVAGIDLKKDPESIKKRIGYMAQDFSLYAELSVVENLEFFAELYGLKRKSIKKRTERLLRFASLIDFKSRQAKHLSGGMQKKLALACTLIHNPEILLLDEPTTGVDPISRREFWNILMSLNLRGTTIVLSTPYMDEADRCSKVGLMYEGRMILCDSPENIRTKFDAEIIVVRSPMWQFVYDVLKNFKQIKEIQTYGESLHLLVDSAEEQKPILENFLTKNDIPLHSIRISSPRMEEVFISLITKLEN